MENRNKKKIENWNRPSLPPGSTASDVDEKEENRNLIGSRWIFQSIYCGILQSRIEEHGASF